MNKLASIIVPCYNVDRFLNRCFNSILAQSYRPIEVIAIDDGSYDNTKKIIKSFKNNSDDGIDVKYYYKDNGGLGSSVSYALPLFTGDYVMWFDPDDILLPNHFETKISFLENNQNCDFVISQGIIVDESDINHQIAIMKRDKNLRKNCNLFEDYIKQYNVVCGNGTVLARKTAIYKAIPSLRFYESRQGQNFQIMLPMSYNCKAGYVDEPLFKYVFRNDSHSRDVYGYKNYLKVEDNINDIIYHTLYSIDTMKDEERIKWLNLNKCIRARNKLLIAYKFKKFADFKKYKTAMGELYHYKYSYLYYILKNKYHKLKAVFNIEKNNKNI